MEVIRISPPCMFICSPPFVYSAVWTHGYLFCLDYDPVFAWLCWTHGCLFCLDYDTVFAWLFWSGFGCWELSGSSCVPKHHSMCLMVSCLFAF